MNQYPAKPMMDQMASYGRYGDTMLVHMNPIEVAGIASLSPTGKLTTNPVTGQPEAFLPLLAPALGMLGGAMGLSTLGTAALTGIGTAALTGDLKRGLVAGLTAGVAGGIGDLFSGAETAAAGVDAATAGADAATELATQQAIEGTAGTLEAGFDRAIAGLGDGASMAGSDIAGQLQSTQDVLSSSGLGQDSIAQQLASSQARVGAMTGFNPATDQAGKMSISGRIDEVVGNLSPMQSTLLSGIGAGQLAEMDVQDQLKAQARSLEEESEAKRQEAYADLQRGYSMAQPGIMGGLSPYRGQMSYRTPQPMYMAEGGETEEKKREDVDFSVPFKGKEEEIIRKAEKGTVLAPEEQAVLEGYYGRREALRQQRDAQFADSEEQDQRPTLDYQALAQGAGGMFGYMPTLGTGIDPVGIQARLRGEYSVAPPQDYMTGFEPEFSYFQQDPNAPFIPSRTYRPVEEGVTSTGDYFDPILDREQYRKQLQDYYTMLASYTPLPVKQAPVAGPDSGPLGGPDAGPAGTPSGPESTFEQGVSLVTGKRWDEMDTVEKIAHTYMRGNTDWYGKYVGTPEYNEAMRYIENKYGSQTGAYQTGLQQEAIDRAAAGMAGIPMEDMLARAGYSSYDEYLAANPTGTQEILGGQDYFGAGTPSAGSSLTFGGLPAPATSQAPAPAPAPVQEPPSTGGLTFGGVPVSAPPVEAKPATRGTVDPATALAASTGIAGIAPRADVVEALSRARGPRGLVDRRALRFQEGGEIPLRTPMGETTVPEGGIANMPTEFNANMPSKEEFNMVASALLGEIPNADVVIDSFVRKYGADVFAQIRDMILQQIVPNAQTKGMIRGEGGGMDDKVNGMIGDQQPVAVSPGEYIVPADVVSGLGDGSSDAGADELDRMLERVRMARGGTAEQAPAIDAMRVMPA
jgi:hypothetical protein